MINILRKNMTNINNVDINYFIFINQIKKHNQLSKTNFKNIFDNYGDQTGGHEIVDEIKEIEGINGIIKKKTSKIHISSKFQNNFLSLYEPINRSIEENANLTNSIKNKLSNQSKFVKFNDNIKLNRNIPLINLNSNFMREMAYDDKQKQDKKGIYRIKYSDLNDLDKKGVPKIKFNYFYIADNRPVTSDEQIRINKLGLAPAYENVWVSEDVNSKIQATGIDVKGRKQYRYLQKHVEEAGIDKFVRLYKFIKSINKLDTAMIIDMEKSPIYSKNRVLCIMLNIVKELNLRIGKEIYAKKNNSYGVTSLKKSHVKIDEKKLVAKFNFKAKSNKQVQYTLNEPNIVKELIELMKLEGEKMFQYRTDTGNILRANDVDLNAYVQKYMGKEFTVKDFRTYAANFYFIKALLKETKNRNPINQKIAKKNIGLAQEHTAHHLRHTKSISKKSYTMDLIRDMYINESNFFIENKNKQPLTILTEILKIFKNKIKSDKSKSKSDTDILEKLDD